ncbi:MAG: DNA-processing protein DprA [Candidatus Dojkabacteria bacterium]|jgi:DNA processing protein
MEIVEYMDSRYPCLLKKIYDPPQRLYCYGDVNLLRMDKVSVVGTRSMTDYGKWTIDTFFTSQFAKLNIAVVSGMARGVDRYAHEICLKRGIKTIAVIPVGVCENNLEIRDPLVEEISQKGLILSEYPNSTKIQKYMFVLRNRIVAGLSKNCIIIEAGIKSGSLITAQYALENNRNIYAVPGNINNLLSAGCNELIKQGATPLNNINEFYEIFGLQKTQFVAFT